MFKVGDQVTVDLNKKGTIVKEGFVYYKVEFEDGSQQMVLDIRIKKV